MGGGGNWRISESGTAYIDIRRISAQADNVDVKQRIDVDGIGRTGFQKRAPFLLPRPSQEKECARLRVSLHWKCRTLPLGN